MIGDVLGLILIVVLGYPAPSAGINLTTYAGTIAVSARIIGSITHASGYAPMPTANISLSNCDISKISEWIKQGKLNN